MNRADSPSSPLHSSSSEESVGRSQKRSSKEREKRHVGSTSRQLVKLLMREEKESHELRSMVHLLSERLTNEAHRADTAEAHAREAVVRYKQANDARLAALQESSRVNEELQLYKLQLDNAQREINRAQGLLDALEAQRHEAEESAARARTTARKLKEEKLIQLARDEGRIRGLREGIAQGRLMGYEEGYTRGRAAAVPDFRERNIDTSPPLPAGNKIKPDYIISSSDSTDQSPPPPNYSTPPAENIVVRPPPPAVPPPTVPPLTVRSNDPPTQQSDDEFHPRIVHNAPPSPQHTPVEYPPEGWVPTVDSDQRIRLPPPHELSPSPYSPSNTPPPTNYLGSTTVLPESPVLMIPPPSGRKTTVESIPDTDSVASGEAGPQTRVRRRRSIDSQSTTFSQFDIISAPAAQAVRGNLGQRPNVLSAIIEEKSPSMSSSPYAPMASPRVPSPAPVPIPIPISHPPTPTVHAGSSQNYYRRPQSAISSPDPSLRNIPSRNQLRPVQSPKGSMRSDTSFRITVEPPSRPESGRSGWIEAEQGMLSANDAERAAEPQPQAPPSPEPIPIPSSMLPPGFVPIGVPSPSRVQQQGSGTTPAIYGIYTPATGTVADVPQSTEPVVVPLPGSRRYSRSALQKDSSSESEPGPYDDPSNSSSSSLDSLTTPPQRQKPPSAPTYATAPTPPNVTYPLPASRPSTSRTSSAVRVPLPPSSTDSPQTSITAARVPLPASSVGSPRSVYTRTSRRGGSGSMAGPANAMTSPVMLPARSVDS